MLEPADPGVTARVFSAAFMFAAVPSKLTDEDPEEPDTRVVEPAVYDTVPEVVDTVATTVSPLDQLLRNDAPRPRLRADCAVADSVREKSSSVIVRVDTGSNSTM